MERELGHRSKGAMDPTLKKRNMQPSETLHFTNLGSQSKEISIVLKPSFYHESQ
jgi:hypothetical protein